MSKTEPNRPPEADVAIVGGGTAGLALAAELKRSGVGRVVVLEREKAAGGIPRHCGHYPFGLWEYQRLLKGPEYAARNVETAQALGVEIRTQTTVTQLHPGGRLSLSTPDGLQDLRASRVVLCTGVRESSRPQRFIGGDRPLGVMTTGALQSLVFLNHMRPFSKPVILGSELVSFSAIDTCRHLGIRPVAMVEELDRIVTHKALQPYLKVRGVPLFTGIGQPRIIGAQHVEALEFTDATGDHQRIETDGIIISGQFRPEAALLYNSHLEVDPGSGGPVIDQFGQCTDPAFYSAGNLLRPAETSGWCWREGVAAAKRIAQDLNSPGHEVKGTIRLTTRDPALKFVLPQRLCLTERPGGMKKMQIGLRTPANGTLRAMVGEKCIWSSRINSRPVRRIQRSLAGLLGVGAGADIRLEFKPET
ncbi:MAG: pyridine nucleotide-disulfide oxidoreductase [Rhodobacteraceae bacterium]|nr:MAG: pyridine nucleotide-disulfide oxidoreductase [Paracoccaceae bacterium]